MSRDPIPELPHNDQAERAILGSILVSNELLPRIEMQLRVDEFFRTGNQVVFAAMQRLGAAAIAIDLVTLENELRRTGELTVVGGAARLGKLLDGSHKSANVSHYVGIVKQKAQRRAIMQATEKIQSAAANGVDEEGLQLLLTALQVISVDTTPLWSPASLEGVVSPQAGEVAYVVDGLLPAGNTTVIGASWKSGKSLVAYRVALDVITGKPVFGRLAVTEPLPVAIFQLEMPPWEDERRLRRLAIGAGIPLEHIPRYAAEGHLMVFNRTALSLTTSEGVAKFHRAVRACGARLIIVDSLIAAFAGADLNDNSTVRALFSRAFLPLTAEGITVLALHPHRKGQAGGRNNPDDRSALLGAQAFGAAASRVYKLERIGKEDDPEADRRSFKLKLSMTGSWTPEDAEDLVLTVNDTEDGGTRIALLDEAEQIRRGGMNARQRAAIALARLVTASPGIERKSALDQVQKAECISASTAKAALWYAQSKRWVKVDHPEGRRNNEAVLVPGETAEDRP